MDVQASLLTLWCRPIYCYNRNLIRFPTFKNSIIQLEKKIKKGHTILHKQTSLTYKESFKKFREKYTKPTGTTPVVLNVRLDLSVVLFYM
jgi:hypothetical protein